MLNRLNTKCAFTLIEVLVSLMVIGVIAVTSFTAISALNPETEASRTRLIAEKLITKSQEEIRRFASTRTNFDRLERDFVFEDITTSFPGFTRPIRPRYISRGSLDLKQAEISITYTDFNKPKTLTSVIVLSSPPEGLPGNVIGEIRNSSTGALLEGINLVITEPVTGRTFTTTSTVPSTRSSGTPFNYDFSESGSGRFLLKPGVDWTISIKDQAGYFNKEVSNIMLDSGQERPVNISIDPTPKVTITAELVDPSDAPLTIAKSMPITLYENAKAVEPTKQITRQTTFEVNFKSLTETRCFTLATADAYKSNYVGNLSCKGYPYHSAGWSTAGCDNWIGTGAETNLCVSPGASQTVKIVLSPVPTASVTGIVKNNLTPSKPIANAAIFTTWFDKTPWPVVNVPSGTDGSFSAIVPAEGSIYFPLKSPTKPILYARAAVDLTNCCRDVVHLELSSPNATFGTSAVLAKESITNDLVISAEDKYCGNAIGRIVDDSIDGKPLIKTESKIEFFYGIYTKTGEYAYRCNNYVPGVGPYKIPAGKFWLLVSNPGYYTYTIPTNEFYNVTGSKIIQVVLNDEIEIPQVALWPKGTGTIRGKVTIGETGVPIKGVVIHIKLGNEVKTATSNATGDYEFLNAAETWPPKGVTEEGIRQRYVQTPKNYTLEVDEPPLYDNYSTPAFTLEKTTTVIKNIKLIPKDQT